MRLIDQKWWIIQPPPTHPNQLIESIGRTCYKSHDQITPYSAQKFVKNLVKRGHESVIEHVSITVGFRTERGILAELTRHRLASFSVESTRYVNYNDGHNIEFVRPVWVEPAAVRHWPWVDIRDNGCEEFQKLQPATRKFIEACYESEEAYFDLIEDGWRPEQARQVLNMSLATEIVMSANVREWRHVLKLRTANGAHPQMKLLMRPLLTAFQTSMPELFRDIDWEQPSTKEEV